ncbi:hypothetical protein V2H45_22465 [Tumidithrix elongata RA019]|uniref:Uncharacterized protein n=1 Tax=Tumidithrix elongata BACA0141 TaxID=2716417 RepID=A0AAW9PWD5_9CYAN|nr:hypothetical protein [Tumidithrix elongata RA019]
MRLSKILMMFACFVGAIVIAVWVSREALYFFNTLLYWIRYNWIPVLGAMLLGAIAYKVFSKS